MVAVKFYTRLSLTLLRNEDQMKRAKRPLNRPAPNFASKQAVASLSDAERVLIHAIMLGFGIAPLIGSRMDAGRVFENMPAEQSRVVKRKFRKLWRKYFREEFSNTFRQEFSNKSSSAACKNYARTYGLGQNPNAKAREIRKLLVLRRIWEDHVAPILNNLESRQLDKDNDSK